MSIQSLSNMRYHSNIVVNYFFLIRNDLLLVRLFFEGKMFCEILLCMILAVNVMELFVIISALKPDEPPELSEEMRQKLYC